MALSVSWACFGVKTTSQPPSLYEPHSVSLCHVLFSTPSLYIIFVEKEEGRQHLFSISFRHWHVWPVEEKAGRQAEKLEGEACLLDC